MMMIMMMVVITMVMVIMGMVTNIAAAGAVDRELIYIARARAGARSQH